MIRQIVQKPDIFDHETDIFLSGFQTTIQTRQFDNQTRLNHLNTRLVGNSDGYCAVIVFVRNCLFGAVGIQMPD